MGVLGSFRGWPIQWNHAKCCGGDPCCHGNEIWAKRGVQSPTGLFNFEAHDMTISSDDVQCPVLCFMLSRIYLFIMIKIVHEVQTEEKTDEKKVEHKSIKHKNISHNSRA